MKQQPPSGARPALLAGILTLAALARLALIGAESLWLDELLVVERISHPYRELLGDWDSRRQGPLFTLLLKPWSELFGTSEFVLRIPSAFFGVVAVWATYALGREWFSERTGLWAAFLLAINPFAIHYSQDARPYTLLMAASLSSLVLMARYARRPHWAIGAGYAACTLAALYSHAFGLFLLPAQICAYAVERLSGEGWPAGTDSNGREHFTLRRLRGPFLVWFGVVLAGYLPQGLVFASTFVRKLSEPEVAGAWLRPPELADLPRTLVRYFMTRAAAAGLLASLALLVLAWARERRVDARPLLLVFNLGLWFVLVPWLVARWITPIYGARYTIAALAGVLLLAGHGLASARVRLAVLVAAVWVAAHAFALADLYRFVDKDPWRQAASFLQANLDTGDLVAVAVVNTHQSHAVLHYLRAPEGVRVLLTGPDIDTASAISGHQRVCVLSGYGDVFDLRRRIRESVEQRGDTLLVRYRPIRELRVNPNAFGIRPITIECYG